MWLYFNNIKVCLKYNIYFVDDPPKETIRCLQTLIVTNIYRLVFVAKSIFIYS